MTKTTVDSAAESLAGRVDGLDWAALEAVLRADGHARAGILLTAEECARLSDEFLERCHARGQTKPTPLLLHYERGGYNCLHQDLYGELRFPLQAVVQLSAPGRDFDGGEFLLVEQRPRAQSVGHAIALLQGEMLIFPVAERPVRGARGFYRTNMRHGVSRVHRGERMTLGIIFHDAA
jgi:hypothetical protein